MVRWWTAARLYIDHLARFGSLHITRSLKMRLILNCGPSVFSCCLECTIRWYINKFEPLIKIFPQRSLGVCTSRPTLSHFKMRKPKSENCPRSAFFILCLPIKLKNRSFFFKLQIKCPLTVRRGNFGPHHIQHTFLCKTLLQWTWADGTEDTSFTGYFTCLSPVASARVFMSLPVADTLWWWHNISFFPPLPSDQTTFACFWNRSPSDWFYCGSRSLLFFLPPNNFTSLPYISPTNTSLSFSLALLFFFFFSNVSHCSVPLVRRFIALTFSIHEVFCIDHGRK